MKKQTQKIVEAIPAFNLEKFKASLANRSIKELETQFGYCQDGAGHARLGLEDQFLALRQEIRTRKSTEYNQTRHLPFSN